MFISFKKSSLFLTASAVATLLACSPHSKAGEKHDHMHLVDQDVDVVAVNSYAFYDLSTDDPVISEPVGTSSVSSAIIGDMDRASYRSDFETWQINAGGGQSITLSFDLSQPTMVQLAMRNGRKELQIRRRQS